MLLPDKHLPLSRSVLGVGAYVLEMAASGPVALDALVSTLVGRDERSGQALADVTAELILAISFLYAIDAVDADENGAIFRCA